MKFQCTVVRNKRELALSNGLPAATLQARRISAINCISRETGGPATLGGTRPFNLIPLEVLITYYHLRFYL